MPGSTLPSFREIGVPICPRKGVGNRGFLARIETKAGVCERRIDPREFLCATVSFDHDIVDRVPAVRFVTCLREVVGLASALA